MCEDERTIAALVALQLEERAGEFVQHWEQWIGKQQLRASVRTVLAPPVRDSMISVLTSVAGQVRSPASDPRQAIIEDLRPYARDRHRRGYTVSEVLSECEALSGQVESSVFDTLQLQCHDRPVQSVLAVSRRLAIGLRALTGAVAQAYRDVEQVRSRSLDGHLSELGRTTAHEMRSRLQAVVLATTVLKDEQLADDPQLHDAQLDVIETAVTSTIGLLDDIHLLSSAELASGLDERQELADSLAFVQREMSRLAQKRRVRLEFADAPGGVLVEALAVQLVLANVIGNAIKYADPAKSERWVRLDLGLIGDDGFPLVLFEVSDNGLGIASEHQDKLFRSRFRALPEVAEGTGLGLMISHALVVERGGSMEMQSSESKGSIFRFTLPALTSLAPTVTP